MANIIKYKYGIKPVVIKNKLLTFYGLELIRF